MRLTGALEGQTKKLKGVQYVNGVATLQHMSREDFEKVLLYHRKCYQVEEVKHGERAPDPGERDADREAVPSRVSKGRRSSKTKTKVVPRDDSVVAGDGGVPTPGD
jgi:hypothetical protein